jgi:hypothetical protein
VVGFGGQFAVQAEEALLVGREGLWEVSRVGRGFFWVILSGRVGEWERGRGGRKGRRGQGEVREKQALRGGGGTTNSNVNLVLLVRIHPCGFRSSDREICDVFRAWCLVCLASSVVARNSVDRWRAGVVMFWL